MTWPTNKIERERIEFEAFLRDYGQGDLRLDRHGDKPDFEAIDGAGKRIGVEITAAYLSAREVPEYHKRINVELPPPSPDGSDEREYLTRLIGQVHDKIKKAKNYRSCDELILGVYNCSPVNHHITTEMRTQFFLEHEAELKIICPFNKIFIYNLPRFRWLGFDPFGRLKPRAPRPYPIAYIFDSTGLQIKWSVKPNNEEERDA